MDYGTSAAHLLTPVWQWNVEQFFSSLVYKVRVQHSDFSDIPQPELRRRFPKTFSDLECSQKLNC